MWSWTAYPFIAGWESFAWQMGFCAKIICPTSNLQKIGCNWLRAQWEHVLKPHAQLIQCFLALGLPLFWFSFMAQSLKSFIFRDGWEVGICLLWTVADIFLQPRYRRDNFIQSTSYNVKGVHHIQRIHTLRAVLCDSRILCCCPKNLLSFCSHYDNRPKKFTTR